MTSNTNDVATLNSTRLEFGNVLVSVPKTEFDAWQRIVELVRQNVQPQERRYTRHMELLAHNFACIQDNKWRNR